MSNMPKLPLLLVLSTVFAAGAAQAGVVDLGIGGANLYSLSNFSASGSDVEGGVLVAGNLSASSYSINDKNKDAYVTHGNTGYALVVGGNLNYSSGSIKNGNYFVGGSTTTSSVGLNTASKTTASPVSFASTSAQLKSTSTSLAKVASTGSSSVAYGGMTLKGGTGSVQVFDLTSAALGSVNNFKFSNLHTNDTLILNISGKNVNLSGGYGDFSKYNVLYNFYEAQNITLNGVGLYGSILAPLATWPAAMARSTATWWWVTGLRTSRSTPTIISTSPTWPVMFRPCRNRKPMRCCWQAWAWLASWRAAARARRQHRRLRCSGNRLARRFFACWRHGHGRQHHVRDQDFRILVILARELLALQHQGHLR